MKTMIFAFVAALGIAVLADIALDYSRFSAADRTVSPNVRLSE